MKIQISIAKIGPFQFLSACMCCHLLETSLVGKKLSAKEARGDAAKTAKSCTAKHCLSMPHCS